MSRFFSPLALKSVDENTSDTSVEDQEDCRSGSAEPTDEKVYNVSEFYFDLSERWATAYLEKADDPLYPPESSPGDDVGASKISTLMRRISSTQAGSKSSTMTKTTTRRSLFSSSS